MQVKIRNMKKEDAVLLAKIAANIMPFAWKQEMFLSCFGSDYISYILELNHKIIGFVITKVEDSQCWIMNFGIGKEYQRQHWGQHLIEYVFKEPVSSFWLEVRASNKAAIAFYSKLGFVEISRRKKYYSGHGRQEDAVVMRKMC